MTGRIIEDDMFGISRRLKSIDDGYYVFLNYKTGKFEVHNSKDVRSLCLVLPYEVLDERTVRHVLYTRAERVKEIVARMERENAIAEKRERESMLDNLYAKMGG